MKRIASLAVAAALLLGPSLLVGVGIVSCGGGCAGKGRYDPVSQSYDSNAPASTIIVGAESFREIALNTFDGLMTLEHDHEAALKALNPEIHTFTERVRRESKGWLDQLSAAKTAYQSARTPENASKLQAATALLDSALAQASKYLSQAATVKEAK